MIASISGTVAKIEEDALVVVVGGVGMRVYVPHTVFDFVDGVGSTIRLHTHLIVRETELTLYGFHGEDDLQLFEILLGVTGVGPKVGLAMLSTLNPEMLRGAIAREETAVLQRVPGIGKKTAERILFQLRDKIDYDVAPVQDPGSDVDADVIDVLTGLGFSIVEAQTALQKVPRDVQEIDRRVQQALQYLDQG